MELTEKQFSQQIEDLLKLYGWRWCHFRPAKTKYGWRTALSGHQGFPDYIATKSSRLIIFEIKSEKGKMSNDQLLWYLALNLVSGSSHGCISVYIWRPSDFDSIVEVLKWDSAH